MLRSRIVAVAVALLAVSGCAPEREPDDVPSERVHAFYCAWYANPSTDGDYFHWNHDVLVRDEEPRSYPGGDDIGANYYPELGCYSSNDPEVVDRHLRELAEAWVGVVCVSWWGSESFSGRAAPGSSMRRPATASVSASTSSRSPGETLRRAATRSFT